MSCFEVCCYSALGGQACLVLKFAVIVPLEGRHVLF